MEGPQCKTLPDELLERIVARMPFPCVFKARGLSKSWRARFSPISSLHNAAQKCSAISFQKLVSERCKDWVTFSPFSIIDQIAYSPASHTWQRMPSVLNLSWKAASYLEIVGPLLLASRRPEYGPWSDVKRCRGEVSQRPHLYNIYEDECPMPHELNMPKELYVANMLTRSWKLLPPRPNAALGYAYREALVIDPSLESYMVVVFCRDHSKNGVCNGYSAQIYDSKSAAWSSKQLRDTRSFFGGIGTHAYFNGVIYMVQDALMHCLLAYHVEAGTWKELRLSDSFTDMIEETWRVDLVVCNSNLMMVVQVGEPPDVDCLHVLKVDLESLELWKVARCPPRSLNLHKFMALPPVSDGRCIILGYDEFDGRMVGKYVDEVIISLEEKRRTRKMKIKEQKQLKRMMKMKIKEEKMKMKEKMNMKMHYENDEHSEYDDDEEEDDDDDHDDDEEEEDEDEEYYEDEDDEEYNGDEADEWICFHSPPPDGDDQDLS